jgi:predicted methyltransferase
MPKKRIKTLISRLKRVYRKYDIELVDKGSVETASLNGKEIDLAWKPFSKTLTDKGAIDILLKDCRRSIDQLIKEEID